MVVVGDVCAPACLTGSLKGFGKGARRRLRLQVWMWAGSAEEQLLVRAFGAGPEERPGLF